MAITVFSVFHRIFQWEIKPGLSPIQFGTKLFDYFFMWTRVEFSSQIKNKFEKKTLIPPINDLALNICPNSKFSAEFAVIQSWKFEYLNDELAMN